MKKKHSSKTMSFKVWGIGYRVSHLRSNPRRAAVAIQKNFSKFVAGGGRSLCSARIVRSAFGGAAECQEKLWEMSAPLDYLGIILEILGKLVGMSCEPFGNIS